MRPFTLKSVVKAVDQGASKVFDKITRSAQKMAESIFKNSTLANTAFGRFSNKVGFAVQKATIHLNNLNARVNRTFDKLKKKVPGIGFLGVIASGAIIKKILGTSSSVAKLGDEAAKNSRRIGFSAEALQELQFAADRSGISAEESLKSFEKLSKNIGDLSANTGSLYTILGKTNPQLLKQLQNAESNEQAFNLITDAIGKLPNDMQKASLSQAAFGRSGQKMLTLIEGGTKGVEELRNEARKYGGVISNEAAKASEDFIDAQTNMNFALKGLTNQIGIALMPKIKEITEGITTWIGENKDLIKTKVAEFADKIGKSLDFIVRNAGTLITIIKVLIGVFAGLKALTIIMNAITTATWLFNAALAANPITWIIIGIIALIAAIAALIIYWEDIVNWVKTSDNVFAKLIRFALTPLMILFKAIGVVIDWVSEKISQLVEWVKTSDSGFAKFIRGSITSIIELFQMIGDIIDWLGQKWNDLTNWITTSDSGFAKFIRGAVEPLVALFQKLGQIWDDLVGGSDKLTLEQRGIDVKNLTPEQMGISSKIEVQTKSEDKLIKELGKNTTELDRNTKSNKKQWTGRFSTTILRDLNIDDRSMKVAQNDLAVSAIAGEVSNQKIQNSIINNNSQSSTEVITNSSPLRRKSNQNVSGNITINVVDKTGGKFGIQVEGTGIEVITTGNK